VKYDTFFHGLLTKKDTILVNKTIKVIEMCNFTQKAHFKFQYNNTPTKQTVENTIIAFFSYAHLPNFYVTHKNTINHYYKIPNSNWRTKYNHSQKKRLSSPVIIRNGTEDIKPIKFWKLHFSKTINHVEILTLWRIYIPVRAQVSTFEKFVIMLIKYLLFRLKQI
jgi:hypothetical protein